MVNAAGSEPWGVIAGYSIAAKTGTAQLPDPQRGGCLCEYGSSYIGIAPRHRPATGGGGACAGPEDSDYFGDEVAGPVFNQ